MCKRCITREFDEIQQFACVLDVLQLFGRVNTDIQDGVIGQLENLIYVLSFNKRF